MNPMIQNLKMIMTVCMEMMHDTAQRMDQAAIEVHELEEHAEELRGAARIMQTWIGGIKP